MKDKIWTAVYILVLVGFAVLIGTFIGRPDLFLPPRVEASNTANVENEILEKALNVNEARSMQGYASVYNAIQQKKIADSLKRIEELLEKQEQRRCKEKD